MAKTGPKAAAAAVPNEAFEQALDRAGSIRALAQVAGLSHATIIEWRRRGVPASPAVSIWRAFGVKLSKLVGQRVTCPHCSKEL